MNRKGFCDFTVIDFLFFVFMVSASISWFVYFLTVALPIQIAKRNYLLKHPEQTVVTELQRGGELPTIPDLNVNVKGMSDGGT